jgi:hypothetical protein
MTSKFRIEPAPTFTATVQVHVPGAGNAPLQLVFKHQGRKALQAWVEGAKGQRDAEFLAQAIAGWDGVVGADDQAVPFSLQALGGLLDDYPAAGEQIFNAYLAELTQARQKN